MKPQVGPLPISRPVLQEQADKLAKVVSSLSRQELISSMGISGKLADRVAVMYEEWRVVGSVTSAASTFVGDMYSGLQVSSWSNDDWLFADNHLRILSGLYGVLSPGDGIAPYRLEMAYRLPGVGSLYDFWSNSIARSLPKSNWILDLSVPEFTKAVLPHLLDDVPVVRPTFLTKGSDGQPKPVVVHAKIARGAMARWAIQNRLAKAADLQAFCELGYKFDVDLSRDRAPVFVCDSFGGLGLSVRLR